MRNAINLIESCLNTLEKDEKAKIEAKEIAFNCFNKFVRKYL
jgi:hypothetical protein